MQLIAAYVVLVLIGDLIAYAIGTGVEYFSEAASLPIFLATYFFVLWIAWVIAVLITAPKRAADAAAQITR